MIESVHQPNRNPYDLVPIYGSNWVPAWADRLPGKVTEIVRSTDETAPEKLMNE